MAEQQFKHLGCPVVVLRISEARMMGDDIAETLRDELLLAYGRSGAVHAVIDMQPVAYLSSAGLRPLLTLNREVRNREGRLLLCGLSPDVAGALTVTRLISGSGAAPAPFEKHEDVPTAISCLYAKRRDVVPEDLDAPEDLWGIAAGTSLRDGRNGA